MVLLVFVCFSRRTGKPHRYFGGELETLARLDIPMSLLRLMILWRDLGGADRWHAVVHVIQCQSDRTWVVTITGIASVERYRSNSKACIRMKPD